MEKKDEYLVYTRKDGTIFHYKNKKLHRDAGPAVVVPKDIEKYSNLGDKDLYKKSISPVIDHKDNGIMKYINDMENDFGHNKWNKSCLNSKSKNIFGLIESKNDFWESDAPKIEQYELAWNNSTFFLDGKQLSEESFKKQQAKKLTKELSKELPIFNTDKTPKLKL